MDCSKKFPIYDLSADMCVCMCVKEVQMDGYLCCVALARWLGEKALLETKSINGFEI